MLLRTCVLALAVCASFSIVLFGGKTWDLKVSKGGRTVQTAKSAADGSFEVRGLEPGSYTVCVTNEPEIRGLVIEDAPAPAEGAIVKSKSNITNNRESAAPSAARINNSHSNIKNLVRAPNGDSCTDVTVGAGGVLRGRSAAEAVEVRPAQAVR